jgi:hypothetical protein
MEPDDPDGRKRALLSLRSAFVLTLALLVALAAGGLLYAAHHSIAPAVLGAGGAFAASVTFLNWVIELPAQKRRVLITANAWRSLIRMPVRSPCGIQKIRTGTSSAIPRLYGAPSY